MCAPELASERQDVGLAVKRAGRFSAGSDVHAFSFACTVVLVVFSDRQEKASHEEAPSFPRSDDFFVKASRVEVFPMTRILILLTCLLSLPAISFAQPLPDFQFRDITENAGLNKAVVGLYNHAVAWGDFDNDGLCDLFSGSFADKGYDKSLGQTQPVGNQLFRQMSPGKFVLFPCPSVEVRGRCSGAVFVDLDNDGDLELYVTSNKVKMATPQTSEDSPSVVGCRLYRNDGDGKFVDVSAECGGCPPTLFRGRDIGVLDYDNDGLLDLLVVQDQIVEYEGARYGSRLFRNLGDLHFEDVTEEAGLPQDLWGAGVVMGDVNADSRFDIFVAYSNRMFISQGDSRYKEAKSLREVFDHNATHPEDIVVGAAFGDLDRDGDLDLITGTHHTRGLSRAHVFLNEGVNDGMLRFREVTQNLGIPVFPQRNPSPDIQDFDNDGWPDLYWSAFLPTGKAVSRSFVADWG